MPCHNHNIDIAPLQCVSQYLHWYGFFPVCVLVWVIRLHLLEKFCHNNYKEKVYPRRVRDDLRDPSIELL